MFSRKKENKFKEGDRITCDGGMDGFPGKGTIVAVTEMEIGVDRDDKSDGGGMPLPGGYHAWRIIKRDFKYVKIIGRKNEWTGAKRGSFST